MLSQHVQDRLRRLIEKHASISAIWLIGSRANGCSRPESDWDFLIFANDDVFQAMKRDSTLDRGDMDILVVYDEDSFEQPWGENPKKGSLTEWGWSKVSEEEATYEQTKYVIDEETTERLRRKHNIERFVASGPWIDSKAKSILVWSKLKGFRFP